MTVQYRAGWRTDTFRSPCEHFLTIMLKPWPIPNFAERGRVNISAAYPAPTTRADISEVIVDFESAPGAVAQYFTVDPTHSLRPDKCYRVDMGLLAAFPRRVSPTSSAERSEIHTALKSRRTPRPSAYHP